MALLLFWGSWVLAILELLGLWLAAKKPKLGFGILLASEPFWIWYGIRTDQWGFVFMSLAYLVVYARLLRETFRKVGV